MVGTSIAHGFRAARREWRLALLLWVLGLLMALAVTGPVFAWWRGATAYSPEANRMLGGLDLGVLIELIVGHRGGWPLLIGTMLATALVARVGQAFVLGGIVEVLRGEREPVATAPAVAPVFAGASSSPLVPANPGPDSTAAGLESAAPVRESVAEGDARIETSAWQPGDPELHPAPVTALPAPASAPVAPPVPEPVGQPAATAAPWVAPVAVAVPAPHELSARERRSVVARFFRGGGRYFLRNLVMLIATGLALLLAANLLYLLGRAVVKPLESTTSEFFAMVHWLLPLALGGLGVLFFALAFDYACIRLAVENDRRPVRTWIKAVGFVFRRFWSAVALWVGPGLLVAAAALVYLGFRDALPATTGALILVMVLMQQLFMVLRAFVRTATVAGEMNYASARGFTARS